MGNAPWQEDEARRTRVEPLASASEVEATLEHQESFIDLMVDVKRGRDVVELLELEKREPTSALLRVDTDHKAVSRRTSHEVRSHGLRVQWADLVCHGLPSGLDGMSSRDVCVLPYVLLSPRLIAVWRNRVRFSGRIPISQPASRAVTRPSGATATAVG